MAGHNGSSNLKLYTLPVGWSVADGPAFWPLILFLDFRGEIIFPMNGRLHLKCQSHIIYLAGGQRVWPTDRLWPLMSFLNFRGEIIIPMNGRLHLKYIIYFAGGQKVADGPAFGPLMPFINFGLLYNRLCHPANCRFLTISVPVASAPAIFIYCESN